MKNLPETENRFESFARAISGLFNSSTFLLSLGVIMVTAILSGEFLLSELADYSGRDRWSKGGVAPRDLYSSRRFTFKFDNEEVEVLPGEKIVSRGEKISPLAAQKVLKMRSESSSLNVSNLWGNLLMSLLCATILVVFLLRGQEKGYPRVNQPLLMFVIVGTLAIGKVTTTYADGDLLYLFNPVPVALILLSIFATTEVATIVHVIMVMLMGVLFVTTGASATAFRYMVYLMVGGLAGIFACSSKQSERSDILRAGMAIGISNVLCIIAINLIYQDAHLQTVFSDVFHPSWFGFFNGIACSMLVLGLIPFLEDLFQVTTSTRYLELINPNHPLMQKLVTEAPGTFHHSQNVAHIAEKAAESIGADPYLTKAASYYHDLGKTKRPYYFVENQMGGVNYHDFLSPQLSKLIIHSHTKDGVEIGRKYGIPKAITDIMVQHHGTDVVAFFYHRARQIEGDTVPEDSFRYPGVKPQSKESAVIMLADACEAATRTMKKPTPQAIENLVSKIINAKFVDGQFDECDLTKRDFETLASSYTKTLVGMYHSRIVYPDEVLEKSQSSGNQLAQLGRSLKKEGVAPVSAIPSGTMPAITQVPGMTSMPGISPVPPITPVVIPPATEPKPEAPPPAIDTKHASSNK